MKVSCSGFHHESARPPVAVRPCLPWTYLLWMWAPLALHKASCWHSRGPSLVQTHQVLPDGWTTEHGATKKTNRQRSIGLNIRRQSSSASSCSMLQKISLESLWKSSCSLMWTKNKKEKYIFLYFSTSKTKRSKIKSRPLELTNLSTVVSMCLPDSSLLSHSKLIFEGQWVNLQGIRQLKSLQRENSFRPRLCAEFCVY